MKKNERPLIDSNLLQTFVRIAECKNLTLAARELGRTQSAISVQLRKLEAILGAPLFFRTAKGMTLTADGETLLYRARLILAEIKETANLFETRLTGSISVGFPDDFDEGILERILAGFVALHPGVQVVARSGCTSGYPSAVRNGELDLAVCSALESQSGQFLGVETIVWAARKGKSWSSNETLPLAILDRQCYWRDLPKKTLDRAGRQYRTAFQSSSFTSLQAALRTGMAVGILPKSCLSDDLTVLTKEDGFPDLPATYRSIQVSPHKRDPITDAMVEAIRSACFDKNVEMHARQMRLRA